MKTRLLFLLACMSCLFMLVACGPSNTIHLQPLKPDTNVIPTPTSSTISVVKFADKRADPSSLGQRRDNSYFATMDNVSDWVSRAVADALAARGFQVTYASSQADAAKAHPEYVLTGQVREVRIKEKSATSFSSSIQIQYQLTGKKPLIIETRNSEQDRTTMPSSSAVEKLLQDTLADVITPMTSKIEKTIRK